MLPRPFRDRYHAPAVRVLVAPQEFKGSLTASSAARAIADGLRQALPVAEFDLLPVADGGPGTVEALVAATGGRLIRTPALDPLGRPVTASWGILGDRTTAIVEMAAASGLVLLAQRELDPRHASTYGTGLLIRAALDAGCTRVIVGVGGSATNDGGTGCAAALGVRFLDRAGNRLGPGGAALAALDHVDVSATDPRLQRTEIVVASDVTNPLVGPEGASAIYGPQKGADAETVAELDAALARLAEVVRRDLGVDLAAAPGAGAAGGLGYGLMVFCHAQMRPGFDVVAQYSGFDQRLAAADLVITGEGRLDAQTAYGKAPAGVARRARAAGKPVLVLAGAIARDFMFDATNPFDGAFGVTPPEIPPEELPERAAGLLARAAEQVGRALAIGARLAANERRAGR